MNLRGMALAVLVLALCCAAAAQEPGTPAGQNPAGQNQHTNRSGSGGGSGRGWSGGMRMGGGNGIMGTVTEVTPEHFTVKTDTGETWTIHYSANTRIMKMAPRPTTPEAPPVNGDSPTAQGGGRGMRGNPPEPIKASDVKVGDAVMAGGEMDREAKSVGAIGVMVLDPERARQMRDMQANYGKTWLMGRLTAIDGTTITVEGGPDNQSHSFTVDENTTFRRRREPITLADLKQGDRVRVDGAVKDGTFVANSVVQMVMPQARGGPVMPRGGAPPR